jgi:hypothetical protein
METPKDYVPECKLAPKEGGLIAWFWNCTFKQVLLGAFSGAGYLFVSCMMRYFIGQHIGTYTPKPVL